MPTYDNSLLQRCEIGLDLIVEWSGVDWSRVYLVVEYNRIY